jgi:outer membrane protein assembly factor BamA
MFLRMRLLVLCCLFAAIGMAAESPRGFAILPVPSLSYSNDEGVEYGGKIFAYQFGDGRTHPYLWHVLLNLTTSTKDKTDFYTFFDVPDFCGPRSRLDVRFEYKNLAAQDYYGLGNQPEYVPQRSRPDSPSFISSHYNAFHQQWRAVMVNLQFPVRASRWKVLGGLGLFHNRINAYPLPSLFQQSPPFGYQGGYSNFIRLGAVYDSRDMEAVPSSGAWSEWAIEPALRAFGSDYSYVRITAIDRRYISIHPRLVWAQRVLAEVMTGSPPFYEMSVIGNSYLRHEGVGGVKTLRGQPRLLYVGPHKMVVNLELRWRVLDMDILRQDLTYYLHAFADFGRVWMKDDRLALTQLHFAEGVGVHVQWKKEFVAVVDVGRSRHKEMAIYLTFGNLF